MQNGRFELGLYGEWRKVVPVEDFYDVLLDAHVRIQGHGGYKKLLKAVNISFSLFCFVVVVILFLSEMQTQYQNYYTDIIVIFTVLD